MLPQFGTAVRKKNLNGAATADIGGGAPDKASVDAAWLVLEAANDQIGRASCRERV